MSWVAWGTTYLWAGVTLFFVLSGFLVGGIILDHRESPNFLSVFYVRRLFRILPLYLLLLTCGWLVEALLPIIAVQAPSLFSPKLPDWSFLFFVQNFAMVFKKSMGGEWLSVTWSLAVEEQFYLVLPVIIIVLKRRMQFFCWVLSACILAALPLRAFFNGGYVLMPWHADALFFWGGDCRGVAKSHLETKDLSGSEFPLYAIPSIINPIGCSARVVGCSHGTLGISGLDRRICNGSYRSTVGPSEFGFIPMHEGIPTPPSWTHLIWYLFMASTCREFAI